MTPLTRITLDPEVMGGKPCIRGLRITVGTIVGLVASGRTAYAARKLDQSAARKVIHLRTVHSTLFSSDTQMIGCGNVGISRAVRDFQAAVEIVL